MKPLDNPHVQHAIKEARASMRAWGLFNADIVQRYGIPAGTVSAMLRGKRLPSPALCAALSDMGVAEGQTLNHAICVALAGERQDDYLRALHDGKPVKDPDKVIDFVRAE